ncbi:MAG: ketol-acid reductoisomerase [Chloroflexi bacterium]|nr:ketol-acid reductoisomerase [Chloroflexota bacterium]
MAVVYRDTDANLGLLTDKQIAVIGYGNMGRPLALNLRDSAFPVLIGNQSDSFAVQAYHDGFEVTSIAQAAARSDLILMMLPDEIAGQVYLSEIAPGLRQNDTLVFASGYTIAFGFIEPPPFVDVVLVAPQSVGQGVREGYVTGTGFPSFVGVSQDASGEAWGRVLALAKALGALHRGALEMTFRQEAELDLFAQQALLAGIYSLLTGAIEVLNREGFPPEAIFLSLYLSGELGYVISRWSETGLLPSLKLHSLTAQYGLLSRIERFKDVKLNRQMELILDSIRKGDFAQEWADEYGDNYPRLEALHRRLKSMPLWERERDVLSLLHGDDSAEIQPPAF